VWRKDGGIKENCPKWTVFFGAFFDALDLYTIIVYYKERRSMRRRELINKLLEAGFVFDRHGGKHDVYKRGDEEEMIPRHREINEKLAKSIIRKWKLK
jgi:mRNA interferase HicA